jgi:hypothetical protein
MGSTLFNGAGHAATAQRAATSKETCGSILSGEARMRFGVTKSWGMILLAVWLILSGLIPLLSISIDRSGAFMNVLAVAAGVLILFGR